MVIECAHCQTRFKLADDKLRPEGTKVRCSKCKEIFTVFPPDSEEPAAPAPLPVTPPAPAPPPPSTTSADDIDFGDLTMDASPAPAESDFSFDMESVAESSPASGTSLEMEDIATAYGGDDSVSSAATAEPAVATGVDFGEFSFDNATTSADTPTPAADETSPFDEFDFGEPPGAEATPVPATADDAFGFGTSPSGDFDFGDTPSDPTAFSFSEQSASEPATTGNESTDFNFDSMSFADDSPKPAPPELTRAAPPAPVPAQALDAAPMRDPREPKEAQPTRGNTKRSRSLDSPLPKPGSRISLTTILLTLVIVLLLGVAGAAVYFYFQPGLFDTRQMVSDLISKSATKVEAGRISVTTQSATYVTSQESGNLFVIRGEAVNEFKTPRTAIAVKGILFNAQGQIIKTQTAFCGNPLSDATLASTPFQKIQEAMANQFGDSLANLDVAPGKAIPFVIVFRQLPADLATYTVELVETNPAPQQ